jgi:predicted NUDIX family NTP pyrophosphohydrolase
VAKTSSGLLPFRRVAGATEVLLVHPGGPYWARKDAGAWSIAKGEIEEGEDALAAARREFTEETGFSAEGEAFELTPLRQPGGKLVRAWAAAIDVDPARLRSNTFTIEWPPRSGRHQAFPEVDRAAWFTLPEAAVRILPGQAPFLRELEESIARADRRDEQAREGDASASTPTTP